MELDPPKQRLKLIEHPKIKNLSGFGVSASLTKPTTQLWKVEFQVSGKIGSLKSVSKTRVDTFSTRGRDLWQSTCFEFFLAPLGRDSKHYCEWNFSPTGHWDFFAFKQYREPIQLELAPRNYGVSDFKSISTQEVLNLEFVVESGAEFLYSKSRFNLSCILETENNSKYYFSLDHRNPEKPDFHLF
jgi:hypothetical protein